VQRDAPAAGGGGGEHSLVDPGASRDDQCGHICIHMEVDMRAIGVRELKEHASLVLRRVRRSGEEVEITRHGRVVARLIPVSLERPRSRASAGAWSTLDRVAREIGTRWPRGRSATAAVREGRRDL